MHLQQFLTVFDSDLFIEDFTSHTKKDVFKEIANLLEATKKIFKAEIIIDLLEKREQLGTTAIGKSIAIPHCRSMAAEKLTVIVGLKQEGVDFDAPDQLPVKIVFVQDLEEMISESNNTEIITQQEEMGFEINGLEKLIEAREELITKVP